MPYVASPAPKMDLRQRENPLSHLVRLMAEYYYPGGAAADPSGQNVTTVPMPQQPTPTSDRLPIRGGGLSVPGPSVPVDTVYATPYEPGMESGGMSPPMPSPAPGQMPMPGRDPRQAIIQALMGAEKRPPLQGQVPITPQTAGLDWWDQIGR